MCYPLSELRKNDGLVLFGQSNAETATQARWSFSLQVAVIAVFVNPKEQIINPHFSYLKWFRNAGDILTYPHCSVSEANIDISELSICFRCGKSAYYH